MKTIIASLAIIALFGSCSKNEEKNYVEISQTLNMDDRFLNFDNTRKEGDAHQGKYYTSADSIKGFTAGYNYILPDSLKNRKIKVYVSAWAREQELPAQGDLIVAMESSKGIIGWNGVGQFNKKMAPGQWVHLVDSLEYSPEKTNDPYIQIGVIGNKTNGKDAFDLDDINLKIRVYNK